MAETRASIQPRSVAFSFDDVPRHWFGGIALATHVANGAGLLFPLGERFFIRSVRRYLDRVADPGLREQVRGFFGQEGRHAQAHEAFFDVLEAQGYEIRRFLRIYDRLAYGVIEPLTPPKLRLAATVALEHYTALLAEGALEGEALEAAHPEMRRLLRWHAAEEIEHKAVAFEVLQDVDPSYALRMAGFAIATACLGGFWIAGTAMLLWQDRARGGDDRHDAPRAFPHRRDFGSRLVRGIRDYVARGFHPLQNDNLGLARDYLASAEFRAQATS